MGKKSRRKRHKSREPSGIDHVGPEVEPSRGNSSLKEILVRSERLLEVCYRYKYRIMVALLPLVVFFTYSHSIHAPFVFDDIPNIVGNPHIKIQSLNYEEIRDAVFKSPLKTRPFAYLSFALNYLFHETNVTAYRLVNFLIHIGNGFLLYLFLNTTLKLPVNRQQKHKRAPQELAFWATLIWYVHPMHVQSITYIVQRMNSMATFFYLLAFICYVQARLTEKENRAWFYLGACIISFFVSLGSKEIAITLPVFIFLYEWFFFRDLDFSWIKKNLYLILTIFLLVIILALSMVGLDPVDAIIGAYRSRNFTLSQRVMTEARVVLHYIDLFLFPLPSRLSLLHEFELSTSLFKPASTLPALLLLNGMVAVAILIAKKERLLSFCLLWFFGNIFLESSVIGLEIIYEHRTYLPSLLLVFMFISLQKIFTHKWVHRAILLSLFLFFSFWTYERNSVWADEVALWEDTLQKHPTDVRSHNALGQALEKSGDVSRAIMSYKAAIDIDPGDIKAYNNLGIALSSHGNIEAAIEFFEIALEKMPNSAITNYNLAVAFAELGYLKDALKHYNIAHENYGRELSIDENVHNNLGILLAEFGRFDEAIDHFKEAIDMNPFNIEAKNNLAVLYTRKKDYTMAVSHFRDAIALRDDDPDLHNRLGLALMLSGNKSEARKHLQEALRLEPGHQQAMFNLLKMEEG